MKIWLLLLVGMAMAMAAPATEPSGDGKSIDTYLETIRKEYGLPALAAAVVKNGEIVVSGAVGFRAQGSEVAVTLEDRFHIGSDTKAMTATLAGMLVDEGKLRWDSTIGEVLGDKVKGMNEALAAVKLEQLLSHSSGIPTDNDEIAKLYFNTDTFDFNLPALRLRAIDAWKANAPKIPEGSPFQYSNFGYVIAGAMIEAASGKSWDALITERIFDPLELKTAGLGPQATHGRLDAAVGHKINDDGTVVPVPWGDVADSPAMLGPAGIAHMSVLDFAKWAAWNAGEGKRGPALVSPETLKTIHTPHVKTPHIEKPHPGTPQDGEYAYGWGIVKFDWAAKPLLQHNGSNSLTLAKIAVDTEADLGIVVMTNFPGEKAEQATAAVLEKLYKDFATGAPGAP